MTYQYTLPYVSRSVELQELLHQLTEAKKQKLILDVRFNKLECVPTTNPDDHTTFKFVMYHSIMFANTTPRGRAAKVCEYVRTKYKLEVSLSDDKTSYSDPLIGVTPDFVSSYVAYEMKIYI